MLAPSELRLRIHPDPALRVRATEVGSVDDSVRALADKMIEIMREADGIGLAAQQVGLDIRMFVCDVPSEQDSVPADGVAIGTTGPMVCINPEIAEPSDDRSPFEEGCLSLPGLRGDVMRPEAVTLRALNAEGERVEVRGAGLLARCWQHEIDHLDGVLIIDRMTQMSRLKVRRKLRQLEAGSEQA
ncbi:MAG: peptide deformylase [Planctomycetota bacterium]